MATRQTWEYLVADRLTDERLNELGAAGWELVSVVAPGSDVVCYLKRPVADLRERVTLDHRQRFVAAAAGQAGSEG